MTTMDVKALLEQNESKDLLRLVTCGSVDDGKSTLIGRLLFEARGIYEDQLAAIEKVNAKFGTTGEDLDLALLTDGLQAEREQGITIDVAYRYFSTPKRKFIIADSPGHEQYTRNMATGASTANLAIILIDARNGVLTQSKRHAFITSLLGIPHLVVAVNKMDLVDYRQDVYNQIRTDFTDFAARLQINDITFIPVSALKGDNVTAESEHMDWYQGPTLMNFLENVHIASDRNLIDLRFPVQYVCRPHLNFRGFQGTVASGTVKPGDEVMALPSGVRSRVKDVLDANGPIDEAFPPLAATITLEDEIDVSRGDMLVHVHNVPHVEHELDAMVVWMNQAPAEVGQRYVIKHTTRLVPAELSTLRYQVDVNTLHRSQSDQLQLNEIGRAVFTLARPIAFDPYTRNRVTGSFIIIDRVTNGTVGAGMILDREKNLRVPETRTTAPRSKMVHRHTGQVSPADRAERLGHESATLWLTGLPGAGKSTVASALEKRLFDEGVMARVLDGENLRLGVNQDLGFSADDRGENVRRAAEIAKLLNETGVVTICALLSPYREDRHVAKGIVGDEKSFEIYLSAPQDVCRQRAPEVYAKADAGEVELFSGITAPYETPTRPDLVLPTHEMSVDDCVQELVDLLRDRGVVK